MARQDDRALLPGWLRRGSGVVGAPQIRCPAARRLQAPQGLVAARCRIVGVSGLGSPFFSGDELFQLLVRSRLSRTSGSCGQ